VELEGEGHVDVNDGSLGDSGVGRKERGEVGCYLVCADDGKSCRIRYLL